MQLCLITLAGNIHPAILKKKKVFEIYSLQGKAPVGYTAKNHIFA